LTGDARVTKNIELSNGIDSTIFVLFRWAFLMCLRAICDFRLDWDGVVDSSCGSEATVFTLDKRCCLGSDMRACTLGDSAFLEVTSL
jgi:hypothetical protein